MHGLTPYVKNNYYNKLDNVQNKNKISKYLFLCLKLNILVKELSYFQFNVSLKKKYIFVTGLRVVPEKNVS